MVYKFLTILRNSQETFFLESVYVEVGNYGLQACNVREKKQFCKVFFGISENLEHPFFSEHCQKKYL